MQALADVSKRRTEAQGELARKEAAWRSVQGVADEALPEVLRSPLIERLKAEHATYEADLSQKSRLFRDDWPELQSLRSKLEQVRERLDIETQEIARRVRLTTESEYRQALDEVRNLDRLLTSQEQDAQQLKRDAVEFNNLLSEVQKKRETLNSLIARKSEMELSTRLTGVQPLEGNIRVLSRARVPLAPFRPNTKLNVTLGLLLGLGLGVGGALLLDYLDNTFTSPKQIETMLGLPTLAMIPRHAAVEAVAARGRKRGAAAAVETVELISHRAPSDPATEAYRELRTAILLSSAGAPPPRLMVTSALPSEGKSATAVNLAIVLAQLGKKVLLVDTDLRRPRLHRVFDARNERGVSTVLSGLEPNPAAVISPTRVPGVDLLPSGPVPPNPTELLAGTVFVELSRRLLDLGYDHVVFDSPPTLPVSDPLMVASAVDVFFLVVRASSTPRESVRRAIQKHNQSGLQPIGIVLNDVDEHAAGHGYGGYRYSYEPQSPSDGQSVPERSVGLG
jgi:capsular exopolysaccharide synthesis family protein